ncbi:MAG: TIGR03960 family B12-binding radical SAM protein [Clostridia bacterium]|nr:TIGR03960 family B12-binding radical SAM protein [Clostridia bacterium]
MDKIKEKILKKVTKPGRYVGGEFGETIKDVSSVKSRWVFCFPDTYEIGMSNLGMRILSGALNKSPDVYCERCFCPWTDMEEQLRENDIPLWALESGDPLGAFDFVAFTLQYELCYTNVLNMLSLAKIPLLSKDREDSHPIIIGGGPCAYNPEPIAEFFDVFSIGEGEEALPEIAALYIKMKESGNYTRKDFLHEAAKLDGFYVPSLYDVTYNEDGTIKAYTPVYDDIPTKIQKRIIKDLDTSYYPDKVVMPYIDCVHDRMMLEVFRGCIRGCRFCQAGMVYRPVRDKSPEVINEQAKTLYKNTGYDEISMSSLSISDYTYLHSLTDMLLEWTDKNRVSLSLPSLRADSFSKELMQKISGVRSSGITFAPEAGTQRLRDAINKNVRIEDVDAACKIAFEFGKNSVKLYFMNGLPTETDEDILGIADVAMHVIDLYYSVVGKRKGTKPPSVTISVACFVPKPFTPFQWEAQNTKEELERKQMLLAKAITDRKIIYNWHDSDVSRIEAVFARGDRKLAKAVLEAHKMGVKLDSWEEFFNYESWLTAFEKAELDPAFYANREFGEDEILPWDMIDCGVTKEFFLRERHKAYESVTTRNCREGCSGCGANKLGGEKTCCPNA